MRRRMTSGRLAHPETCRLSTSPHGAWERDARRGERSCRSPPPSWGISQTKRPACYVVSALVTIVAPRPALLSLRCCACNAAECAIEQPRPARSHRFARRSRKDQVRSKREIRRQHRADIGSPFGAAWSRDSARACSSVACHTANPSPISLPVWCSTTRSVLCGNASWRNIRHKGRCGRRRRTCSVTRGSVRRSIRPTGPQCL